MSTDFNGHGMDISLRDYVDVFQRRRAIIIQTFVAIVAIGFVLNLVAKPRYRSSARIVLKGKSTTPTTYDADNPLADLFLQDQGNSIATQVGMIQGEEVLTRACKEANIPPNSAGASVSPVQGTDLVDISTESENQDYAYKLAYQLPKTYNAFTKDNETLEITSAKKMAQKQLHEAKSNLRKLQKKLGGLRQLSQVFSTTDDLKFKSEAVDNAQSAVSGAQSSLDTLQAQLALLIMQRENLKPSTETPTVINNPDIPVIEEQIASRKTDLAGMSVLLTNESPKVQAVLEQIKDLQARLAKAPKEVTSIVRRPNDEIAEYDKQIKDTRVQLAGAQAGLEAATTNQIETAKALVQDGDSELEQSTLEDDVERIKAQGLLLTKTISDLDLRAAAVRNTVTDVTKAHHAVKVAPKQKENLLFAGLLGLVLGVCFALLQEYLDDRVNTPDHVKGLISAPTLGFIPMVKQEAELLISGDTASALMESYRALRSNVGFATVDSDTNAILITSTRPGEGKSTTAVNLASSMALDDKKVILVDLDLRRPTVHQKLGLDPGCGVTNVLMGHKTLAEALQPTEIPGLEVLTSGPLPPNPAELMNSQAMRRLLDELKHRADVVIIDSPPLLATADSQVLSALVDGVVFVMQFGVVRKPELRHAYSLLQQANINMLGVVFNKIDVSANRDYVYGVYQHYTHYTSDSVHDSEANPLSSMAFKKMISQIDPARRADDLPAERGGGARPNAEGPKPKNEKRP